MRCIYAPKTDYFFWKAAKDALLDKFQIGFKFATDEVKKAFFRSVKGVLAVLALMEIFDDIIDRNIEKLAQSSFSWMSLLPEHLPLQILYARSQTSTMRMIKRNQGTLKY